MDQQPIMHPRWASMLEEQESVLIAGSLLCFTWQIDQIGVNDPAHQGDLENRVNV